MSQDDYIFVEEGQPRRFKIRLAWFSVCISVGVGVLACSSILKHARERQLATESPSTIATSITLPAESAEALLFDLDGTIIDDVPFQNALRACLPWKKPFGGGIVPWPRLGQMQIECALDRFDFLAKVAREQGVQAIQAAVQIAMRAKQNGKPIGLVTRAPKCWVEGMLNVTGLQHLFINSVWVTKNTRGIKRKKPHPDPWLLAAKKLGVSPQACICYDDSDPVLDGLRNLGMMAIDVKTLPGYPHHEKA